MNKNLAFGLFLISAMAVLNCVSAQPAPVARFVAVGSGKLQLIEQGLSGPPVVFVSGLGEDHATWQKVQPGIAQFARTLSYDRAGLGKSDPTNMPRGINDLAKELHALLVASGVPGPYVLVGHSLGGAIVRFYAGLYPGHVAGLVFVDPEDGRLLDALRSNLSADAWAAREAALAKALPQMPPAVREELGGLNSSTATLKRAGAIPTVPVVLLTGTKKNPAFPGNPLEQDLKLEIHRADLVAIPGAVHVLVPSSRHYVQNDEPEQVIEATRNVINRSCADSKPLSDLYALICKLYAASKVPKI